VAERKKREQPDRTVGDIPLIEWIAAAVGAAIVVTMLVFLAVKAAHWHQAEPPMMRVEAKRVVAGNGGYVLVIDVINSADNTAANAQVEGTLKQGGMEVETSGATIDYVPGHSHNQAGLQFSHDPDAYQVELRVTGFEQP
jgi:uncharacterized protein (TIGR02588 family)